MQHPELSCGIQMSHAHFNRCCFCSWDCGARRNIIKPTLGPLLEATGDDVKASIDFGPNHVLAHTQDAWGKVCIRAGESAPEKGFRCSKTSGLAETHGSALKKSFYYLRVSISLVEDCFQGVNGEGWAPSDTRTSLSTLSLAKYEHDLKEGTYLTIWKKQVTGTNSGLSWVGLERL